MTRFLMVLVSFALFSANAHSQNPYGDLNPNNPYSAYSSPYGSLNPNNPYSELTSPYGSLNPNNPYSRGTPPQILQTLQGPVIILPDGRIVR